VTDHVIEAAANHVSGQKGGVAGIYDRAAYGPQKARAGVGRLPTRHGPGLVKWVTKLRRRS
jgi:hypothetical protein